jgi:hypothetical protein
MAGTGLADSTVKDRACVPVSPSSPKTAFP